MPNTSSLYISFQAFQRESLFVFRRLGERTASIFVLKKLVWVLAHIFHLTISAPSQTNSHLAGAGILFLRAVWISIHNAMQKPKKNHRLQSSNLNFHITGWFIEIIGTSYSIKISQALFIVRGVNYT